MSIETPGQTASRTAVSRRTIAKGVAWATPALVVASAAPAVAASLRKDPGINGWVLNSWSQRGCRYTLTIDSTANSPQTPDGAPYGLYLYDIEDENAVVSQAKLTYWIIGEQAGMSWTSHSPSWSGPSVGRQVGQVDGNTYTTYTWTYTPQIDAGNQIVGHDDVRRLWLDHFNVSASFSQTSDRWGRCQDFTFWAQRTVTVDRDGSGPKYEPEVLTFQRRAGALGSYAGTGARSAGAAVDELADGASTTALA